MPRITPLDIGRMKPGDCPYCAGLGAVETLGGTDVSCVPCAGTGKAPVREQGVTDLARPETGLISQESDGKGSAGEWLRRKGFLCA